MKTIKFGIIGAGVIAEKFVNATKITKGAEIIAVASKSMERAESFKDKFNLPFYYDSYEQMLENPEVDAVYIATTHNFHYENCLLATQYNKHIICEKPFVLTKQQAEDVFKKAREKNLFVMEAMWNRFLPAIKNARQWIKDGKIGDLKLIDASFCINQEFDPKSRLFDPKLAGGALFDIGVYPLEFAAFMAGEHFEDVSGYCVKACNGVDAIDAITAKFPSGILATIKCAVSLNIPNDAFMYGTNGYIKVSGFTFAQNCELYDSQNILVEKFEHSYENGFEFEIAEAISCINNGKLESDIITHADTINCAGVFDELLGKWDISKIYNYN